MTNYSKPKPNQPTKPGFYRAIIGDKPTVVEVRLNESSRLLYFFKIEDMMPRPLVLFAGVWGDEVLFSEGEL